MRGISSYDSSSISMLFSSLGGGANGGSDLLGINYSDYASIKSGSYGKLMRSYYALESGDGNSKASAKDAVKKTSTALSKDSSKTLAGIEEAASDLTDTAKSLYSRKSNSVFSKDSKGNYNSDKIYDTVSDFVENYNSLLSAAGKSDTTRIQNAVDSMTGTTKMHEDALKKIGITIDSKNGTLGIHEDTFKSADMSDVKTLFNGTGSFAYGVATQSSMIDSYAQAEASRANTYGASGKYNYNYNSGNIFYDSF